MGWLRRIRKSQDEPARGGSAQGGSAQGGSAQSSRLDRALFPVFGPAQVGPYDEPEREYVPVDEDCSICFRPMSQHITDRSGGRSRIVCPRLSPDDVRALPHRG